ncbi:palmitoyl-monogalactosyldiacylglycerol delta-7 desaturase, chloroplastic isoform X1 [Iris pallida]|uniref:Palmitoyl-monogalactosyldiacylglycerol delta-7 desaturase, chloroplastic isoform X1 n=1 Tax=Iris pallida TaxID=29817 RepID=A0AAX6HUZ6_IRIPA|nr:palmitoyl-monogalactosyldiacylglycerol delta-7 desaturase, chloroplastic isoform X1 [Iris pallida]
MNMSLVLKSNILLCTSPKQTLLHHHQHHPNAAPNSLKPLLLFNNFLSAKAANATRTGRFPPLAVKCLKVEEAAAARAAPEEEAAAARVPEEEEDVGGVSRILWSDVVAKPAARTSTWALVDVLSVANFVAFHGLCLFAPFTFSWGALWTAVALYFLTGMLGITLSYHRHLSHRSFKLPKWLEYTFAYLGAQAGQGDPLDWVCTHRYHHQHCDTAKDSHTPTQGFWFSHITWLFDIALFYRKCGEPNNVGDLAKQPFYWFLRNTYPLHPLALGALLYAVGGFPYVVWGMGVRIVCLYHAIWLLNSACHLWGYQTWKTKDLSRNNWWVALLSFGEGWHNNHHAFEYSARHGLKWWEVDMTWYVVKLLEAVGLATDVRLPSQLSMKRLSSDS